MNEAMLTQLTDGLRQMGLDASRPGVPKVAEYIARMLEKNRVMNLSAIREPEAAVRLHALDALSIFGCLDLAGKQVLDVGTGGGFPGIPLAILFPEKKFTLMDSLGKRIKIIDQLAKEIGISNVELVHARAEDLAKKKEYREQFDVCVSRAVANLSTLSEYCIPFVKVGGYFVPYKTAAAQEEIVQGKKAMFILGGHLERVTEFGSEESGHTILWIQKVKPTPAKYPRKAGTPSKEPLK